MVALLIIVMHHHDASYPKMTPKRPQRIRSAGELPAPVDWIRRSVGELPAPVDRIETIVVLSGMYSGCISSFCCSRIVSDVCGTIDGRGGGLTMTPKRPQRIRSVGELPAPVDWIRRSVGELPAPVDRTNTIVVLSAMYSGCISSFCCSRKVSSGRNLAHHIAKSEMEYRRGRRWDRSDDRWVASLPVSFREVWVQVASNCRSDCRDTSTGFFAMGHVLSREVLCTWPFCLR